MVTRKRDLVLCRGRSTLRFEPLLPPSGQVGTEDAEKPVFALIVGWDLTQSVCPSHNARPKVRAERFFNAGVVGCGGRTGPVVQKWLRRSNPSSDALQDLSLLFLARGRENIVPRNAKSVLNVYPYASLRRHVNSWYLKATSS